MRLPFWATFLTIISVSILCGLGLWQLERLKWKTAILEDIEKEYALDAKSKPLSLQNFDSGAAFRRGTLKGQYLHDKSVKLSPRTHNGQIGFHLLTPFKLSNEEKIILVNRGFAPHDQEKISTPQGIIKIAGMLRNLPEDNIFVPQNIPEKNIWYRIDLSQIGTAYKISLLPNKIFILEEDIGHEKMPFPIPVSVLAKLNNNHALYAIFWFSMATALTAIYVLRFMKKNIR